MLRAWYATAMREGNLPAPQPDPRPGSVDMALIEAARITAACNALMGMGLDGGQAYCLALLQGAVQRGVLGGPNDGAKHPA